MHFSKYRLLTWSRAKTQSHDVLQQNLPNCYELKKNNVSVVFVSKIWFQFVYPVRQEIDNVLNSGHGKWVTGGALFIRELPSF